jgi:hypothetical protein
LNTATSTFTFKHLDLKWRISSQTKQSINTLASLHDKYHFGIFNTSILPFHTTTSLLVPLSSMDGADDMRDIWSPIYDAQQLENPHLQRRRSTPVSSDSGSNENGSSTHVFDEMAGLECPHPPQSTPTGSEIAADGPDNISESDSYIGCGSSDLRSTPPNEQENTPTGAQIGVNSVQDWWDRSQALVIDEFEIKLVHRAILLIVSLTPSQSNCTI